MHLILSTLCRHLSVAVLAVMAASSVAAEDLRQPEGEVLLTVTGDVPVGNGDGMARFDRDMLAELESRSFTTETIWTEGPQTFTGVGLDTLVAHLGIEAGTITATAINDYSVEIPLSDAAPDGPIIAYLRNGEPMPLRDKGPLWIVYPYDDNPAFQSEITYSRSIWQLDRIAVDG